MNKIKFGLGVAFLFLITIVLNGQVFDPPIPFPKLDRKPEQFKVVREADVLFAIRLWQRIDMRQPVNKALNKPLDSAWLNKRSFFQVIVDEVIMDTSSKISIYESSKLNKVLNRDVLARLICQKDTLSVENFNSVAKNKVIKLPLKQLKANVINMYLLEDWFYDRQISKMDRRILAVGLEIPVFKLKDSLNVHENLSPDEFYEKTDSAVFIWFYYPELRPILANCPCYLNKKTEEILSFDQVLINGYYSSYVIKDDQELGKTINEYSIQLDAVLESLKSQVNLFYSEIDLWQY